MINYETNESGETLKVTTLPSGTVIMEVDRPFTFSPPTVRRLSKLAYMNRFADGELAALYTAAKTIVQVEVWLAKFNATTPDADGTSIDLDDPRTIAGVQALEAAGILATGRAAEILS